MNSSDFNYGNEDLVLFVWYDYIIFIAMIIGSTCIGVYFGCFGTKQATTKEYLLGNKQMAVIPTVISLMAGNLSGVGLLGSPVDVYLYGGFVFLVSFGYIIVGFITTFVFLPVFHQLQITSIYEYLEMRFDARSRKFASFLFVVKIVSIQPISFFIATLAFSTATNISVDVIVPIFFGLCIFYTSIGGYKTVIWTDTLQFLITYTGYILVFIFGMYYQSGGINTVFTKAHDSGRLDIFDMDISFIKRDTFWSAVIGYGVSSMAQNCASQATIQKILCVPTLNKSRITSMCFSIGAAIVLFLSALLGLLMYAKYETCDPFMNKNIDKADQLLPFFVIDTAKDIPGLSGIFISGIFCTALSCLSSNLNCMSCTIYEDFLKKRIGEHHRTGLILRIIVVVLGLTMFLLTFIIKKISILFVISLSLVNCALGPLLGLFTLGILFPTAKSQGSFYGSVIGFISISILVGVSIYYKFHNTIIYPTKPVSIESCGISQNMSNSTSNNFVTDASDMSNIFILFRISHNWFTFIGFMITVCVGLILSMCETNTRPISKELLSPIIHPFVSKQKFPNGSLVTYCNVQESKVVLGADTEKGRNVGK